MPTLYIGVVILLKGQCDASTGELLARAKYMHYDNNGYNALKCYAALKGLNIQNNQPPVP